MAGILFYLFLASCQAQSPPNPSDPHSGGRPEGPVVGLIGEHAMVVSAHPLASEAGKAILLRGGNAIDAAVAVHFALAVTFPYAGNLGGGGFLTFHSVQGENTFLDFREIAPSRATESMFLDEKGNPVPKLSTDGILAAGVPGSVEGMWEAHQKFGTLAWKDLLEPARQIALNGFPISANEAKFLNQFQADFARFNPGGCPFLKKGGWLEGDTLRQTELAGTLARLQDQGRNDFYLGKTAELIVNQSIQSNGLITKEDLIGYKALWREPLVGAYRGRTVVTAPPPSAGGIALLQLLFMAENINLGKWNWHSAASVHWMAEMEKRVFADRSQYASDPGFFPVPTASLLDSAYLLSRLHSISDEKATPSEGIHPAVFSPEGSEETTHFSILDAYGNAVSVTTTLNGPYGNRVYVQGAGFLLNNEMDDFSVAPGVPNKFGLTGGKANAIAPGKRMVSSMTPTLVLHNGQVEMVVGTPGGSTIITTVFQILTDVYEHEKTLQEAVNAPRFHHQWLPDEIALEEGAFSDSVTVQLKRMGHALRVREAIGRVDAIRVYPDGRIEGAADPRRDDAAAGY